MMFTHIESISVFYLVLGWLAVTAIVAFSLQGIAKRQPIAPAIWIIAFLVTSLTFIPFSLSNEVFLHSVHWMGETISPIPQKTLDALVTNSDSPISLTLIAHLLLSLMALISLHKVFSVLRTQRKLRKLVTSSLPFAPTRSDYTTYITSFDSSAFALGFTQPVVALPEHFIGLPRQTQQLILAHEYMHIKLGDPQVMLLWRLLCALFWFNPFLRILELGYRHSMELRCDKLTIRKQGCSPIDYAQSLLTSLKLSSQSGQQGALTSFIQLSGMNEYKHAFATL